MRCSVSQRIGQLIKTLDLRYSRFISENNLNYSKNSNFVTLIASEYLSWLHKFDIAHSSR